MLGMNVGLDVRVIDQIGLANPLAGHLTAGGRPHRTRQGMFPDWEVAEGPF
jgi:arabinofuranosyltransferase